MFYCHTEEKGLFLERSKKKKESYLHTVNVRIEICFQRIPGNTFPGNI